MTNFTKYEEAKVYFTQLANSDTQIMMDTGKDILEGYDDILEQAGEFVAAKYLVDVYTSFLSKVEKSEKETTCQENNFKI